MYTQLIKELNERIEKLQSEDHPQYALIDDLVNEIVILKYEGKL